MKLNIEQSDNEEDDGPVHSTAKIRTNRRHQQKPSCMKQMFYCLAANQSFRLKRKRQALAKGNIINSVSKIDSASRVLFPVTFSIINVIYWWGFIAQNNDFTWKQLDHSKFYWPRDSRPQDSIERSVVFSSSTFFTVVYRRRRRKARRCNGYLYHTLHVILASSSFISQ